MLILRFGELLKTSRPGKHLPEIILPAYHSEGLCVVHTYKAYIKRTRKLRGSQGRLFIQTVKPHRPVQRDTFGKWIRVTLQLAGVDMGVFAPHSSRSAATSAAKAKGVPLATILRTAGWESANTFRKFYDLPVVRDPKFAETVLGAAEMSD